MNMAPCPIRPCSGGAVAATRRLRLGTAISILTFHNPLTVAENYALVDQLSQGRLSLGVGSAI